MQTPTVFVPRDVLNRLSDAEWFKKFIVGYYYSVSDHFGMQIKMSASSILEAHTQWSGDLERISEFELKDGIPDHFKQAGHLAYWLRRCKPIYELNKNESYPPAGTKEDCESIKDGQELLFKYANEYLAFSLGYHICMLHTIRDEAEAKEYKIDKNYLEIVCQFLRNKNVSPHALYLIYRSLFHRPKK